MAGNVENDGNGNEDAWLEQLREALASTAEAEPPPEPVRPVQAFDAVLGGDEPAPIEPEPELFVGFEPEPEPASAPDPEPVVATPTPPATAPPVDSTAIVEALASVNEAVRRLDARLDASEAAGASATSASGVADAVQSSFDQVELDVVVADAIRSATMKAQATGAGTVRLETEVRLLEQTVAKLSKQVNDVNITALARDRLEKDVHVERLAEAAERVERQLAAAAKARTAFAAGVDKMLRHAAEGGGDDVAWTDVMLLTHELRSRVDDLDDQQRRAMRDLTEWQASMDDRMAGLRAQLLDEIRSLRDPLE
ncbi:MAG: hypothetical protein OSA99_12605 [Acidimicrobiales bacterium]|nr:hypothetical protein [Acidimicrobiales bacterium]